MHFTSSHKSGRFNINLYKFPFIKVLTIVFCRIRTLYALSTTAKKYACSFLTPGQDLFVKRRWICLDCSRKFSVIRTTNDWNLLKWRLTQMTIDFETFRSVTSICCKFKAEKTNLVRRHSIGQLLGQTTKQANRKSKPKLVSGPIVCTVIHQSIAKRHQFENCDYYKVLYGRWAERASLARLPYKSL